MEEEKEEVKQEAGALWDGLDEYEYEWITEQYMSAAEEKGFKYQDRPNLEDFIDEELLDKCDKCDRAYTKIGGHSRAYGPACDEVVGAMEEDEDEDEDDK